MVINFLLPMIGDSGGMRVIYKYSELLTLKGHDVVIYRSIKASNMHRYKLPFVNTIHRIYCSIKALLKIDYKESKYDKIVRSFTNSKIRNALHGRLLMLWIDLTVIKEKNFILFRTMKFGIIKNMLIIAIS